MRWITKPSRIVDRLLRRQRLNEHRSTEVLTCSAADFDLLATDLVAHGATFRLRVWGGSMYPSICSGDLVLVEPVDVRSLRPGDVLFYRRRGGHLAHRLVELREGGNVLITRGDALDYLDPPVKPQDVLGRVVAVERSSRKASP